MKIQARAAGAVAAVYGFFLIFAQFAFVELLRGHGAGPAAEKWALGAMAVAGIAAGFGVAKRGATVVGLRLALVLAACAAVLAPWASGGVSGMGVAVLTGLAVGGGTVSLAALLPGWCGARWIGWGTGLGYAICNVPWVFSASPEMQAWIGAGFALLGSWLVPSGLEEQRVPSGPSHGEVGVGGAVVAVGVFLALVWLDSAAFFIIQHERDLKEGTWGGAMLWRNAGLHLLAGGLAGEWLARRVWKEPVAVAWGVLAIAALAVNHPSTRGLAGWMYPVGVSIYSAALVTWPGWAGRSSTVVWRAAWVFAVAGWFGSANGIGMAQALQRVPWEFVAISGAGLALALTGWRAWRQWLAVGGVLGIACWRSQGGTGASRETAEERGRQVYLAEGCIACHSRFVRPEDPEGWGPPSNVDKVLHERPVTIGNRRQGPDLTHVGARRSAAWLKEHFLAPQKWVVGSPMPSYAHLFEDDRGADLIAWLMSDQEDAREWRGVRSLEWRPEGEPEGEGSRLFAAHCAVCHGPEGRGDGEFAKRWVRQPANLVEGPFVWTVDASTVARAIHWGLPGTDMPGHELLSDGETLALAKWVLALRTGGKPEE
ncbi:cytochrome c oxidase cbb3-type subunit 2 [Haloferula luteola]|uniref:Cytochrome c oxidase cbb3-type subunit 2 n=1 Tax=Haloferula luteola TaxID=595692 RepID=A0A840VIK8_9BACT|nr:cbb3-type cytochrome c oxidase subunit II [Haloferula luteola]MBB5352541.1 cytochrome c oxidase cbb3-type subunit 2 [Haloferula luteola]